jgi:hypothetical protein
MQPRPYGAGRAIVKEFEAFFKASERYGYFAHVRIGVRQGRVQGERAFILRWVHADIIAALSLTGHEADAREALQRFTGASS